MWETLAPNQMPNSFLLRTSIVLEGKPTRMASLVVGVVKVNPPPSKDNDVSKMQTP